MGDPIPLGWMAYLKPTTHRTILVWILQWMLSWLLNGDKEGSLPVTAAQYRSVSRRCDYRSQLSHMLVGIV